MLDFGSCRIKRSTTYDVCRYELQTTFSEE
jgi:hypothetical protein